MRLRGLMAAVAASVSMSVAGLIPAEVKASQAVPSLSAQSEADLQCMVVFAVAAGIGGADQDESALGAATAGLLFYLGRLQGREPATDWIALIAPYADTLDVNALQTYAERCAQELGVVAQAMIQMGSAATGRPT